MATPLNPRTRFAGSWRLISFELHLPSGEVRKPLGEYPEGRILYLENGQMSAQLMRAGAAPIDADDPLRATAADAAAMWRNYMGYWGTYTVDDAAAVVVHSVEGGWFPNWIGQKQVRAFRFTQDHLILEADSPAGGAVITWQRLA